MTHPHSFRAYEARLLDFIEQNTRAPGPDDPTFASLALELFELQREQIPLCRRLWHDAAPKVRSTADWRLIPPVPAAAFKELWLSRATPGCQTREFHSSGTSGQTPSRHAHDAASLALYECSLWAWFRACFVGCESGPRSAASAVDATTRSERDWIFLTPPTEMAPHSSLVHMFETIRRRVNATPAAFAGNVDASGAWTLDFGRLIGRLEAVEAERKPVALLGTAFGFVQLLDELAGRSLRLRLPAGSRVMETGGYKGHTRSLPREVLHAMIAEHLGVPATEIIREYGMSELSSQAYDRPPEPGAAAAKKRCLRFPPWCRVRVVSPETGTETAPGEAGLIQVFDLANVASVLAIQTADLGVAHTDGFELLGRAVGAEPRGCSLTALPARASEAPPAPPERSAELARPHRELRSARG